MKVSSFLVGVLSYGLFSVTIAFQGLQGTSPNGGTIIRTSSFNHHLSMVASPMDMSTYYNNKDSSSTGRTTNNHQQQQTMAHFMAYLDHKEKELQNNAQQVQKRIHTYQKSLQHVRQLQRQVVDATVMESETSSSSSTSTSTTTKMSFTETTQRSLVKSLVWRIVAGVVTACTTLQFTNGSWQAVVRIVSGDFASKAMTMFVGERLMNRSAAGRSGNSTGGDNIQRSLVKALLWRLFAISNTLCLALFVAHSDLSVASKIASTDAMIKTALMFTYERVWARIHWGKEYYLVNTDAVPSSSQPPVTAVPSSPSSLSAWRNRLEDWWRKQQERQQRSRTQSVRPEYQLAYSSVASSANMTAFGFGNGL
jgi:uncharacterized membrane protein